MKLLTLSFLALVGTGAALDRPASPDPIPAVSYAPEDAADSLWRAGRVAIADEDWRRAARLFEQLVNEHPTSAYAGDALYWQAFALQRTGSSSDLRRAARALETQREKYATSATYTSGESAALLTRVNGRLARSGDAEAGAAVAAAAAEIAASVAPAALEMAAAVAPAALEAAIASGHMSSAEAERARAEMARGLAEARAEMAGVRGSAVAAARASSRARSGRGSDEIPPECEGVIGDDRIEALNALMQMNSEQALPVLRRVLERRDRCSEVLRRKAVFIVAQRRNDEAADILVNVVRNDPDRTTRSEAVFWLSQVNTDRSVTVLEGILKTETDEDLQKRAIFALSQANAPRAGEILRDFAGRRDANTELRAEAIFWIGQRGRGENSAFLRELFPRLDNDELRDKAIFAVAQRRSPENAAWLLERAKDRQLSAQLRKSALFWASQSGGATVADLGQIYDTSTEDRELRGQVIFALSQRRNDSAAVDRLLAIARTEQDAELRRQALFWLGQSRDPRAAAALEEIINKPL
ncbi:HEAT repeat domain-containing protein [Pseudogemmatithrix spongiicola]|uniref:HEAT repeat domain-containing protein n=1 Tax=Pseudogemmatithrix spongiicola TaxID=3062599 RepID=A0AA49JSU3_9BACT|nr:HEAT repeat domain-containing protein [Gemmatimonadaceae bacterium 'strain 138']WKW14226.1 HEAT repeat domain-containing protein [Gemmatimonadaceae bacterium 'strain 318']